MILKHFNITTYKQINKISLNYMSFRGSINQQSRNYNQTDIGYVNKKPAFWRV